MNNFSIKKHFLFTLAIGAIFLSFSFKSNFFEVAKQLEIYLGLSCWHLIFIGMVPSQVEESIVLLVGHIFFIGNHIKSI